MVSNEIMRNSDVFMRNSHFLISPMKTWEKQVIVLIVLRTNLLLRLNSGSEELLDLSIEIMLETCSILFCSETSNSISVVLSSEKEPKEKHILLNNIEFEPNANPNNWKFFKIYVTIKYFVKCWYQFPNMAEHK